MAPLVWLLFGATIIAWAPILFRLSELGATGAAFWRLFLAAPILASVACLARGPSTQTPTPLTFLWTGSFFALDLVCWHSSIARTTVANATLFANMAPLVVAGVSVLFLGERFRGSFWLGLAAALGGAVLLVGTGLKLGTHRLIGDTLGLATAFFYAGYFIGVARLRTRYNAATVMAGVTTTAGIIVGALLLALREPAWPPHAEAWWALLFLALGPQVIGQGSIAHALAYLPAAYGAVTLLFQPVVAALIAAWLFGETLSAIEVAGMTAILVGIATVHLTRKSAEPGA